MPLLDIAVFILMSYKELSNLIFVAFIFIPEFVTNK